MKSPASILILLLLRITDIVFSQTVTQTVKGKIFDNETQIPLIGATVVILGTNPLLGGTTDLDGNYMSSTFAQETTSSDFVTSVPATADSTRK